MKAPRLLILTTLGVLLAAPGLHAQPKPADGAASPTAPPNGDPFKGQQAKGGKPAPRPPFNYRLVLESYLLPQAEAGQLLAGPGTGAAMYGRVRELAEQEQAKLEWVGSVVTKNRSEATNESLIEYRYPSSENLKEFEFENLGQTIQFMPTNAKDSKSAQMVLNPEQISLTGFQEFNAILPNVTLKVPDFYVNAITTRLNANYDDVILAGSASVKTTRIGKLKASEDAVRLVFARINRQEHLAKPEYAKENATDYRLTFAWYSLPMAEARKILAANPSSADIFSQTKELAEKGPAKLEKLQTIAVENGGESTYNETEGHAFASQYNVVKQDGKDVLVPVEFKTRDLGWKLTIKPQVVEGMCDLAFFPEHVQLIGETRQGGSTGQQARQPIFATQRVNTRVFAAIGEPTFYGTFSPAMHTGLAGDVENPKVWLGFVTVLPAQ